jgi:hypothetical protein
MMNGKWRIIFGVILILASFLVYLFSIIIFKNPRDTAYYLIQNLAFLPMQVLFVTVILDRLMSSREKKAMMSKLNMVIGAFFSEAGTDLIKQITAMDRKSAGLTPLLLVKPGWKPYQFSAARKNIRQYPFSINIPGGDLFQLKTFLMEKRSFMLSLLENPNLLEHEAFTELLWAVFHLTEELTYRNSLDQLHQLDMEHLSGDIKRVYTHIIQEWLSYMEHMKNHYPYLFSLAVRMNPFDSNSSVEIRE